MQRFRNLLFMLSVFVLSTACQRSYLPQNLLYSGYDIKTALVSDSTMQWMLNPYTDSVGKLMNDVVGELKVTLKRGLPDGTLGNFLADAYLQMAKKKYNSSAQIAFMNNGGIRLNSIAAGHVKRGIIFEVMPFDNQMVIMEVKGSVLKQYLDVIAKDGGGGIAGLSFVIRDKKASDVLIGGQPLDLNTSYIMVNSDYVVNGGGGFTQFRDMTQTRPGYLLRDAIIDYCFSFKNQGQPIEIKEEKRIRSGN